MTRRLKLAGSHLLINIVVFAILLIITLHFWYPAPYFSASGGLQGIKLVVLIDIILGPLLTFTVASKTKRKSVLRKDLLIIIILQFSALLWGVYAMYSQRPVAAVFWEKGFYTVTAKEYRQANNHALPLNYKSGSVPMFYAERPKPTEEFRIFINWLNSTKLAPYTKADLQRPISDYFASIRNFSVDINDVISKNVDMKAQLLNITDNFDVSREDLFYIPLRSKYKNILIVFDRSGAIIGYLHAPFKHQDKI